MRYSCGICGGQTEKEGFSVTIELPNIEKIEDVCRQCLDAGPVGASKRALEYAERLKNDILYFEAVAEQLSKIEQCDEWIDSKQFSKLANASWEKEQEAIPA